MSFSSFSSVPSISLSSQLRILNSSLLLLKQRVQDIETFLQSDASSIQEETQSSLCPEEELSQEEDVQSLSTIKKQRK